MSHSKKLGAIFWVKKLGQITLCFFCCYECQCLYCLQKKMKAIEQDKVSFLKNLLHICIAMTFF